MSGETAHAESGWTVDTLHAHLQQQIRDLRANLDERYATQTKALDAAFAAQQTANDVRMAAQKEAIGKAEVAANERFALLNELRSGVATKEQVGALETRLSDLKERLDRSEGRGSGLHAGWGYLVGAVGLLATVVGLFIVLAR